MSYDTIQNWWRKAEFQGVVVNPRRTYSSQTNKAKRKAESSSAVSLAVIGAVIEMTRKQYLAIEIYKIVKIYCKIVSI